MNCYREMLGMWRWWRAGMPKRKYFPAYFQAAGSWVQVKREHWATELRYRKQLNRMAGMAVFYGALVFSASLRADWINVVFNLVCFGYVMWRHSTRFRVARGYRRTMRQMVTYFGAMDEEERTAQIAEFNRFAKSYRS